MGFLRYLPFETGIGDRILLAVATYIAINLLWMRFFNNLSGTYIGVAIALLTAVVILRWG